MSELLDQFFPLDLETLSDHFGVLWGVRLGFIPVIVMV